MGIISRYNLGSIFAFLSLTGCGGPQDSGGPAPPLPAPPTTPPPVVFMGDSITQLWGINVVHNYSPNLLDHVPGSVNKGISGNTLAQMLARFPTDVLEYKPSVVVILGGTNDAANGDNPVPTADLFTMVNNAQANGARVVVGTVPLIDFTHTFNPAIVAYNSTIRASAASLGYTVADYAAVMTDSGGNPISSFYRDGLHPNGDGYAAMWGALQPVLNTLGVETE